MTQSNYIQLYSSGANPDSAYLLEDGAVYLFASDTDKYAIKGKNLIVCASEIILNRQGEMNVGRLETAVIQSGSTLKKIPADRLVENMKSYSFLLNASMVLAKQVSLTNEIIHRNTASLEGDEKKLKEMSIEYYRLVCALKKEYEKRRLPFLKEVFSKYETSLVCKRGEAFDRSTEPTRVESTHSLSDRYRDYAMGETICEEGEPGDEMYILQSGTIDVYIGKNRVASIGDQGTIIGEMSLLLGEKRAATLKARNNVVVTAVSKANLREIAEKEGGLFLAVALSLAKKHYSNIDKINGINTMIIERELNNRQDEGTKKMMEVNKAKNELASLKNDISRLVDSKGADYLAALI